MRRRPTLAAALLALLALPSMAAAQVSPEADGDDDPADTGTGPIPARARFERVGRPRGALRRVCDITPFRDALYFVEAFTPLGSDGARVFRYLPSDNPFSLVFDWNRPGEPTRGGGGGQGFLRVHAMDGRLAVPDADPPYGGLGAMDPGTEGYVFLSNAAGEFAPPRMPGHRLPPIADLSRDRAGAAVLPRAYHVLDAIRWRGAWVASAGSVPPRERAWAGTSPGALHVADARGARWTYTLAYPANATNNVWRLTYLVRFRGRLYAGIQDYFGREPNDYVVVDAPAAGAPLSAATLRARRVTPGGGAQTVRWFADAGRLYWITLERDGRTHLRVTDDGETWTERALPAEAGNVTDLARWRGALVALTDEGLWRVDLPALQRLASAPTEPARVRGRRVEASHFAVTDLFCAAPLAVYRNELYAGSQRDGSLWRLVAE